MVHISISGIEAHKTTAYLFYLIGCLIYKTTEENAKRLLVLKIAAH